MQTLLRKWWVILLQGILLIIIGIIFFNNPVEVLAVISLWIGILTLAAGIIGLIAHFMVAKEERENSSLWWSVITLVMGFLMVTKVGLTMKVITIIFGAWVLLTGIWLLNAGWEYRKSGLSGWIMLLGGALSVIAGIAIIFDIETGAVWISTLLGLQAIISGIGFIMLAFIKRKVVSKVKSSFG